MKVYISGPMTGIEDFNFPLFNAVAKFLQTLGWRVENPAEKGIVPDWDWEDYLRYDIEKLMQCEYIVLLPGWENSRGARLEVRIARELGFTFLDYDEYIADLDKQPGSV